jgi:hypothetical protein
MPADTLWYVLVSFGGGAAGGLVGSLPAWLHWWRDHEDEEPRPLPLHTSDADPGPVDPDDPAWHPARPGETEQQFLDRIAARVPPLRPGDALKGALAAITGPPIVDLPGERIDWRQELQRPLLDLAHEHGIADETVEVTIPVTIPPPFAPEVPADTPTRWVRTPRVLHLRGCRPARVRGVDVPAATVQEAVAYAAEQRPPLRYCHQCHPVAKMAQEEGVEQWPAT